MRYRQAIYQEGELAESILALDPRDLLDEEGYVRDWGELIDEYYRGPGRAFGRVYEILKLADRASSEEMHGAEEAMEKLNRRIDAYKLAVGAHDPEYDTGESWERFSVAELDDGIYIVVEVGGLDV